MRVYAKRRATALSPPGSCQTAPLDRYWPDVVVVADTIARKLGAPTFLVFGAKTRRPIRPYPFASVW